MTITKMQSRVRWHFCKGSYQSIRQGVWIRETSPLGSKWYDGNAINKDYDDNDHDCDKNDDNGDGEVSHDRVGADKNDDDDNDVDVDDDNGDDDNGGYDNVDGEVFTW